MHVCMLRWEGLRITEGDTKRSRASGVCGMSQRGYRAEQDCSEVQGKERGKGVNKNERWRSGCDGAERHVCKFDDDFQHFLHP